MSKRCWVIMQDDYNEAVASVYESMEDAEEAAARPYQWIAEVDYFPASWRTKGFDTDPKENT